MPKQFKKNLKSDYLGFRLHPDYTKKLEKRRQEDKDNHISETARKILYKDLDNTGVSNQ